MIVVTRESNQKLFAMVVNSCLLILWKGPSAGSRFGKDPRNDSFAATNLINLFIGNCWFYWWFSCHSHVILHCSWISIRECLRCDGFFALPIIIIRIIMFDSQSVHQCATLSWPIPTSGANREDFGPRQGSCGIPLHQGVTVVEHSVSKLMHVSAAIVHDRLGGQVGLYSNKVLHLDCDCPGSPSGMAGVAESLAINSPINPRNDHPPCDTALRLSESLSHYVAPINDV